MARLGAQAEAVARLNAHILASRSATAALETWCATGGRPAEIRAEAIEASAALQPEQEERLRVRRGETVTFRRVRLTCGGRVLSEADNWYVPARLDARMNHLLETTALPFGKAVSALDFRRETFATRLLRQAGAEDPATAGRPDVPAIVLEHRALLFDRDERPFSEVHEHYTEALLAFGNTPEAA